MRKFVDKILPLKSKIYIKENLGYRNIIKFLNNKRELKKLLFEYKSNKEENISIKDNLEDWYKSWTKFIVAQPQELEVAIEFFRSKIEVVKISKNLDSKVILICIVKNDLLKLKNMINHHRNIGVTHFAIIDNNSTDNTLEWLKTEEGIDIFSIKDKYNTNKREAWINRIISYYGINRWYLVVDSDELFTYKDMEKNDINKLINYFELNSYKRVRALMIDMYGNDEFYKINNDKEYIDKCKFFDLDSYKYVNRYNLDLVIGGPRSRIFNEDTWLTKYPLFYFEKGDIHGKSHFLFPYIKNKDTKCATALLHYKFLTSDIEKYRRIAIEGSYYGGSKQYKNYIKYIDKNKYIKFKFNKSVEYIDSNSIYKIKIMDSIDI